MKQIPLASYVTISGGATEVALARYNANGALDTSFGTKGMVTTAVGASSIATAVAIDASGNIVVAGAADGNFALARYTSKGVLDTSFGTQGTVETNVGPTDAGALGLALQPTDGKIVVVGHTSTSGGNFHFAVLRYNTNGTLDTSFNHTGEVLDNFPGEDRGFPGDDARAVAIQADGKIVAAGGFLSQNLGSVVAVARYNADGSPDTTFNGTGKTSLSLGGFEVANALTVQGNGKIVVAGNVGIPGGSPFATVRYNGNGTLDTSFGKNGVVRTKLSQDGNDEGHAVAIQADGKIVTAGTAGIGNSDSNFALVRYIGDQSLNATGLSLTATAGAPFAGTVATFTAADANLTAGQFSALITWGDGATSAGTVTAHQNGGFDVAGGHTYAAAGPYMTSIAINGPLGTTVSTSGSASVSALGQSVSFGDAARIDFWGGKDGQTLIKAFNGGTSSTALSAWLAGTFVNLFGADAGTVNVTGMTNAQVAAFYEMLLLSPGGPRVYAQVMATALNVYATTQSLGGMAASQFGFRVTATGLGAESVNVGDDGAAFGVGNGMTINVYQALLATNKRSAGGILYGGDRELDLEAGAVYHAINRAGTPAFRLAAANRNAVGRARTGWYRRAR
jgi:uncharacterized delta-60 repeat protein